MKKTLPKKRFGQNFLRDPHIIGKIVQSINPQFEDHMVEIGPGQGALTFCLQPHLKSLSVIEIDNDLIEGLTQEAKVRNFALEIIHQDVLDVDFSTFQKPLRVVGNLPYNISTPLLFHLLNYRALISDMFFMLQKEVVDRIVAKPHTSDYGRLSVMLQAYCEVEYLFTVKPGSFFPAPKVDSAIVRLKPYNPLPYEITNPQQFSTMVRLAFMHRRKTISNCLASVFSSEDLKNLGIDPKARAENLTIKDYIHLANNL